MTRDELLKRFPHATEDFLRPNATDGGAVVQPAVTAGEKRLRQSSKPILNELETRYYKKLLGEYPGHLILCQAVRLELARGIWYKPDLFIPNADGHQLFFEVKGPHVFRGGFENLKVAARVHGWAKFFLVWEDEDGTWKQQEILK